MIETRTRVHAGTLRWRLVRSFGTLALVLLGAVGGYQVINGGPTAQKAPTLLRGAFEFNERIARNTIGVNRPSVSLPSPSNTTLPRFNGDLGLDSDEEIADPARYTIEVITDQGSRRISLSDIKNIPATSVSTLFKCVEGWSEPIQYSGARFADFLRKFALGTKTDGSDYRYVGFETPDGEYYVSIDLPSLVHPQTVLAYEMNGQPLTPENGAPIRLVIPIKYGIKSIKRVGKMIFSDVRPKDYWAERGYDWFSGL